MLEKVFGNYFLLGFFSLFNSVYLFVEFVLLSVLRVFGGNFEFNELLSCYCFRELEKNVKVTLCYCCL